MGPKFLFLNYLLTMKLWEGTRRNLNLSKVEVYIKLNVVTSRTQCRKYDCNRVGKGDQTFHLRA